MAQYPIRQREETHLGNMRRLDEDDRLALEHLADKWAREHDSSDLPAGVIPFRPKAA